MNKVLLNSRNIDRSYISSMNVTESCYLIEVRTIFGLKSTNFRTIFEWHKPSLRNYQRQYGSFHTSYHLKLYQKTTLLDTCLYLL